MKYTIEVTKEDIESGEQDDGWNCPVKLAASRALESVCADDVLFTDGIVLQELDFDDSRSGYVPQWSTRLPRHVIERIAEFDAGNGMKPFSFEIEL